MRTFRIFDPEHELFVFDPEDEDALLRCAREFNFHPDDFSHLHWKLGDIIVIEPADWRDTEMTPCGPKPTTFNEIVNRVVKLEQTKIAILEAAVASRQGIQLRVIIDGRLWWIRPGSGFLPVKFFCAVRDGS